MEDKSLKEIFNDMDQLWEDFKSKTWKTTIWESQEAD
jgi:hypothetical protein